MFLPDGQIVMAAKLKDRDQVMSFHFRPTVEEDGKLRISLAETYLGRAPVPRFMLASKLEAIRSSLNEKLPKWQAGAKMDASGLANEETVKAAGAKLLLAILDDKPAENVLFLPNGAMQKSLPVRLEKVEVKNQALTLDLRPMTPEQREAALEQIKKPVEGAGTAVSQQGNSAEKSVRVDTER